MKINYYNKTVFKDGSEVPHGTSIIIDDSNKVFVGTTCIQLEILEQANGLNNIKLQLEEDQSLILEHPSLDPQALIQKLKKWEHNYLSFSSSFMTLSRARPYGVGVNCGDITQSPLQISDVMDAFLDPAGMFFNQPILRRGKDDSLVFLKKAPFSRKYEKEINLPVFSKESFETMVKRKSDLNILDVKSWCVKNWPSKKIKIVNNSSRNSLLPTRKWVPGLCGRHVDHYTYLKIKRDVLNTVS